MTTNMRWSCSFNSFYRNVSVCVCFYVFVLCFSVCRCHVLGSVGSCDQLTGSCECDRLASGPLCDRCLVGSTLKKKSQWPLVFAAENYKHLSNVCCIHSDFNSSAVLKQLNFIYTVELHTTSCPKDLYLLQSWPHYGPDLVMILTSLLKWPRYDPNLVIIVMSLWSRSRYDPYFVMILTWSWSWSCYGPDVVMIQISVWSWLCDSPDFFLI